MGLLGMVLTIGLAALKFGLFVVLPVWLDRGSWAR